jgi:hypothetical protein
MNSGGDAALGRRRSQDVPQSVQYSNRFDHGIKAENGSPRTIIVRSSSGGGFSSEHADYIRLTTLEEQHQPIAFNNCDGVYL